MASEPNETIPVGNGSLSGALRSRLLLFLVLGAVLLAAYANSFQAPLLLDNKVVIGTDPRIRDLNADNLRLIFTKDYWFPHLPSDLYRPFTTLSYLFNYAVLGNEGRPFGYHAVNFLLHWANAWLVFRLLHRLSARLRLSFATAVIFAVHPVNVESVTNIVGRADLLATFSVLVAGLLYLRGRDASAWERLGWNSAAGLVAVLGAFTKESAVMVLPVMVLTDLLWPPAGAALVTSPASLLALLRRTWPGYAALVPALLAVLLARHLMPDVSTLPSQVFVDNPIAQSSPFSGFMTAAHVIGRYVFLFLLPLSLAPDYSYNQIPLYGESAPWWHDLSCWLALGLILYLLVSAFRWWRLRPLYSWGVLVFLGTLLPTANLLFPIGSIMAQRFLYLPSVGFCLVIALGLATVSRALAAWRIDGERVLPGGISVALPIAVVAALVVRTHARNADWRDELAFWSSAAAASPESFKTHKGLAGAIYETLPTEENLDIAIARLETGRRILEQRPLEIKRREATLYVHLGIYLRRKGDSLAERGSDVEARGYFRRAVAVLEKAREVDRFNVANRLKALRARGETPAEYGDESIYATLGYCQMRLEAWREVEETGAALQKISPSNAFGYTLVGVAEAKQGRVEPAIVQFAAHLVLNPNDSDARTNIIRCYEAVPITPNPVTVDGSRLNISITDPRAEAHMAAAMRLLIANHERAGRQTDAARFRETAVRQFSLRPALLDVKKPVGQP